MPGPGNYSHTDSKAFGKSGVAVTISGKSKSKYNENPGPGSYD
jgi:hypothetical protein